MCSYVFVSMAYGMMMENAGFAWYYSLFTSLTVYTGAFQFVLITFLSSDGTLDEQQAEFLQSFIFGDIPKDGKKETLYDPYDDRRNVCSKLYDRRQR